MKKPDELDFLTFVKDNSGRIPPLYWDKLTKRQYYILKKWAETGYWDCGVSLRSGWLTKKGWDL